MLTHKVGLPPNHKVPKTHYNFPLYPVMLVVGVSKMMVVSDEVDVEQNNVRKLCPHIEDGRSGKVQPLQKRRLPNI